MASEVEVQDFANQLREQKQKNEQFNMAKLFSEEPLAKKVWLDLMQLHHCVNLDGHPEVIINVVDNVGQNPVSENSNSQVDLPFVEQTLVGQAVLLLESACVPMQEQTAVLVSNGGMTEV